MNRTSSINHQTPQTEVSITLDLDGSGIAGISTGIAFFDHMLDQISRHALVDLTVDVKGDGDPHHTVDAVGVALGRAINEALGNRRSINRFGDATVPMDESLASVAIDLGGRVAFVYNVDFPQVMINGFSRELVREFFKSMAQSAKMNLHVNLNYGSNGHHIAEAIFKAFSRALREAVLVEGKSR